MQGSCLQHSAWLDMIILQHQVLELRTIEAVGRFWSQGAIIWVMSQVASQHLADKEQARVKMKDLKASVKKIISY